MLSGVAGRIPVAASRSSSSSTPGTIARASQRSSCTAPGPHGRVVAALLDGRPDDHGAVAPRHEVDRTPVHEAADRAAQQGSRRAVAGDRRAEAQDVPLDRAHGGQPGALEARDRRQPGPGRQEDVLGVEAPAVRQDQLGPGGHRGHRGLQEGHAGIAAGRGESAEQGAVVDLVIARHLDAAAQGRAECGHEAAAFGGAAAVRAESQRVLVREQVVEAGAVRRIERDRHRARGVVADGPPGGALERGGEAGPQPRALEEEGGERGLAELRLGDRGEHAGGDPRRAVTPGCRRDDRHIMTVA